MAITKGSKFLSNRDVSLPMASRTGTVHVKTGDKALIVLADKSSITIMIDGVSNQVQLQAFKDAIALKDFAAI